jgi:hypothetical protein
MEVTTTVVNSSYARSQSGMREEFDARRLFFGDETTDITVILDCKFCACVGVDSEEESPALWFGKVLGVKIGHGAPCLLTTVGDFVRVQGRWYFKLQNGGKGAATEFDFAEA